MEKGMIRNEIQISAQQEKLDELLEIFRKDMNTMGCPVEKQISLEIF